MSNELFVRPVNQNEQQNKKKIAELIGAENLAQVLGDIVGSSQHIVDDVYAEIPSWSKPGSHREPIKNLSAGDPTSDSCVIWVKDPKSDRAYSVEINFSYVEHLKVPLEN